MREIKFRAWDKKHKSMIEWEKILKHCDRLSFLFLPEYNIMQYTGLKDKNGKEIYEGDIIDWAGNGRGVVEYWEGDAYFEISDFQGATNGIAQRNYNEVIGNIHENANLLEGA